MTRYCPRCGSPRLLETQFCASCGFSFAAFDASNALTDPAVSPPAQQPLGANVTGGSIASGTTTAYPAPEALEPVVAAALASMPAKQVTTTPFAAKGRSKVLPVAAGLLVVALLAS